MTELPAGTVWPPESCLRAACGRELHRAVEAQAFVGGVRVEARIVAQSFELRPMVEERECAVADEVDRGLVAGDEQ